MDFFSTGYSATALVADVAAGAQSTFASMGPILAIVGGIILAFIGINYVISLTKKAGKR